MLYIYEEFRQCIVRCFADDIRVTKKITTEAENKKLYDDRNTIDKWAEDIVMKFNGNKFEQETMDKLKMLVLNHIRIQRVKIYNEEI